MAYKSKFSDLAYVHEDDLEELIRYLGPVNGQKPIYLFYSPDDEAYFGSFEPIDKARIVCEFPDEDLCITGNCEE